MLTLADNLTVFGDPIENAIEQITMCMDDERAVRGALMAGEDVFDPFKD